MPRTQSPARGSDIDGRKKKGDGFFIIYDYKEDVVSLLLLSLLAFSYSGSGFPGSSRHGEV